MRMANFSDWSIRKKLLVTLIPTIVLILAVTGYVTNWFSNRYLNMALGRSAKLQAAAQAHEIEGLLNRCREDLLILANAASGKKALHEFMAARIHTLGGLYRELAFVCLDPHEQVLLASTGRTIVDIPPLQASLVKNNPLAIASRLTDLRRGSVQLSGPIDVFYPPTGQEKEGENLSMTVFRLTTPQYGQDGLLKGYLVLSLEALAVRNILSLFNSPKSPLPVAQRSPGFRFSFFFDRQGWILFESENLEDQAKDLNTDMARGGLAGDHGKPGYDAAFKPAAEHSGYWKIVADVQNELSGPNDDGALVEAEPAAGGQYYQGYAPVPFLADPDKSPEVVGGVAYVDRVRLTTVADFRQYDVMFIITIGSILTLSLIIFFLSRIITRPIRDLTSEVINILRESRLRVILLPDRDQETSTLKLAMNNLITSLLSQEIQLKERDVRIRSVQGREKVELKAGGEPGAGRPIEGVDIVGASPAVGRLASLIRKAAQSDADVLIIGETGTGKELAAEAIHKLSERSGKPFIAVNCGALDENLLLDALFGHAKGAFSDAKTERKGAFQAAEGGTLLLDEIGNASPKVQQSLLRALSVRKIKPLGTDAEVDFDARVIAATNVDLAENVRRGVFREDLYYRLKVLAIPTPPLRSHKADIPLLAEHFLKEAAEITNRHALSLSRGALEKMVGHDWPGNVRELKNCLTRAVALAEHDVLYAEDVRFAEQILDREVAQSAPQASLAGQDLFQPGSTNEPHPGLNRRQRQAWARIQEKGSISRQEYQDAVGGGIPPRTAQYDLTDLVKKGLLVRQGKGPATRYYATNLRDIAQ